MTGHEDSLPPIPPSQMGRRTPPPAPTSAPPRSPAELAGDGLLGAALQDPQALARLRTLGLTANDFQGPQRTVWNAIKQLGDRSAVTPLTVADRLDSAVLTSIGGMAYLSALLAQATPATFLHDHVSIVQKAAQRRAVDQAVANLAGSRTQSPAAFAAALNTLNTLVTQPRPGDAGDQTIGSVAAQALTRINEPKQTSALIPTGLPALDAALRVLPGQLCVLAARPSVGKTLVGMGFALHAARRGIHTTVMSLEMTPLELGIRALASQALCDVTTLIDAVFDISHGLSHQELERLDQAKKRLADLPLTINAHAKTLEAVEAAVGRAAAAGAKLIVVDHLHLIQADDGRSSETVILGRITVRLKAAAHQHGVAIWLLAQLSRASETRPNHRPLLSDLRQSGEIEANADNVVMLYRAGDPRSTSPGANLIELIIAKQRNGPTGVVKARWDGPHQRLLPLD